MSKAKTVPHPHSPPPTPVSHTSPHENVWQSRGRAAAISNLGARWRWMVSFTSPPPILPRRKESLVPSRCVEGVPEPVIKGVKLPFIIINMKDSCRFCSWPVKPWFDLKRQHSKCHIHWRNGWTDFVPIFSRFRMISHKIKIQETHNFTVLLERQSLLTQCSVFPTHFLWCQLAQTMSAFRDMTSCILVHLYSIYKAAYSRRLESTPASDLAQYRPTRNLYWPTRFETPGWGTRHLTYSATWGRSTCSFLLSEPHSLSLQCSHITSKPSAKRLTCTHILCISE